MVFGLARTIWFTRFNWSFGEVFLVTAEARMGPVRVGAADRGVAVSAAQPGQCLVRRRVRLVGQFLDRAEDEVLEIHEYGDLRRPVRLHRPAPSPGSWRAVGDA